jgi:NAD(P)-dependent dehydrogenase (short-subunit alcohol dehydrogenase family)
MEYRMKTVLITGCSSGHGLKIAHHFFNRGWKVIATMRKPDTELFPVSDRSRVLALDVTDPSSIAAALDECGQVDVLVNNAGIGAMTIFEGMPFPAVREMFETNTFGTMAMTQAMLPRFRQQGGGSIVTITTSVTFAPMPLTSVYAATKAAVEGFMRSLAFELADMNIRLKIVQPGYTPGTALLSNAERRDVGGIPDDYATYTQRLFGSFGAPSLQTTEEEVADMVYRVAEDVSAQICFPAGADAVALAQTGQIATS